MLPRTKLKKKLISIFKEALSFNNNDNKQPVDPFGDVKRPQVNVTEKEKLKGGLADGKTLKDIANLHAVPVSDIKSQVQKGIYVEHEHTSDSAEATEIAKDHEVENPEYYDDIEAAGLEETQLNEMPYFFDIPDKNGKPLDLQIEKWNSEGEFKKFLSTIFSGESYTDVKQPTVQIDNAEKLLKQLTNFDSNLHNPATQFLVHFTRSFRANGRKITLKSLTPEDSDYLKRFVADAYNKSKESFV
jgi:hypothetical protein